MKSIMHDKREKTCYLCMMLHGDYNIREGLEEHHVIYGTARRRLSEKYGLKVYLCHEHHEDSREAVHKNKEIDNILKDIAQRRFEQEYPTIEFVEIFGKNYKIPRKEKEPQSEGFTLLDVNLDLDW